MSKCLCLLLNLILTCFIPSPLLCTSLRNCNYFMTQSLTWRHTRATSCLAKPLRFFAFALPARGSAPVSWCTTSSLDSSLLGSMLPTFENFSVGLSVVALFAYTLLSWLGEGPGFGRHHIPKATRCSMRIFANWQSSIECLCLCLHGLYVQRSPLLLGSLSLFLLPPLSDLLLRYPVSRGENDGPFLLHGETGISYIVPGHRLPTDPPSEVLQLIELDQRQFPEDKGYRERRQMRRGSRRDKKFGPRSLVHRWFHVFCASPGTVEAVCWIVTDCFNPGMRRQSRFESSRLDYLWGEAHRVPTMQSDTCGSCVQTGSVAVTLQRRTSRLYVGI